jgi:nitroreductase
VQAIEALLTRNSAGRLAEPAPRGKERETLFQAALRAPDHARLRPWRFLVIEGPMRQRFGDAMVSVSRFDNPQLGEEDAARIRAKALRAPMLIVVAAAIKQHPKVPEIEQQLSAGCAAMNILNACHAMGYGGMWRTGSLMFHPEMPATLGLDPALHRIIGVLYIGSVVGETKELPRLDSADYFVDWEPQAND